MRSALRLTPGMRAVVLAATALPWLLALDTSASAQPPSVLATNVRGAITPVVADHLTDGVEQAGRGGHVALLVELDTPGGLDTSMREIVQEFLGAPVPVVVHVAPAGARAASAGAIITMAAHVAGMAPGTTIGAATPVDLQGGEISEKVVNDAASYAESIARLRARNTEFAVEAVREGRSVTADEAVELGVVDLMARSRTELLDAADGRKVRVASGEQITLETADAEIVRYEVSGFRRVLQWLADPNLTFLFLSLGTLAIVYELANPGIGAGGIVGVLLILLALFGLSVLPVNALGAILLFLSAVLFIAEVLTPGVGVFAAGGTASLLLGGMFLFRGSVEVDPAVLVPVTAVAGAAAVLAGRLAWASRQRASSTGEEALLGRVATVRRSGGSSGQVLLDGAWWTVRSRGKPLEEGEDVRVVDVEGLELIVEEKEGSE